MNLSYLPVVKKATGDHTTSSLTHYWQLSPNMASQFKNELCCIRHCLDVNEQNTVKSVRVDDSTAK